MAATRTPGITIGADGRFFIDKRYRGIRIGIRVGALIADHANQFPIRARRLVDLLAAMLQPRLRAAPPSISR